MNIAKVTVKYEGQPAYTLTLRSYEETDPLNAIIGPGGQIIKSGLDSSVEINGKCTLSEAAYKNLRAGFKETWNHSKKAKIRVLFMIPGVMEEEINYRMGVVKISKPVSSLAEGGKVECNVSLSCREEEGINDYYADPLSKS